jgi:hypothetical protein
MFSPRPLAGERPEGVRGSIPRGLKPSFATPSPDPLRLMKAPAAGHPLPQGGEG